MPTNSCIRRLALWLCSLLSKRWSQAYLSSIRHLQISAGLQDPFAASMPRLEQVLKGIKVNQGRQGRNMPNQKLPITPEILRRIKSLWQPYETDPDYIMLWAACCVCFFGFMWSGELTVPSQSGYDSTSHLSFDDMAVDDPLHPNLVQLTLKASKTDPFRRGMQLVIGSTQDDLCPVAALLAYVSPLSILTVCEGGGGGGMPLVTDASLKRHGSRLPPPSLKSCMTP